VAAAVGHPLHGGHFPEAVGARPSSDRCNVTYTHRSAHLTLSHAVTCWYPRLLVIVDHSRPKCLSGRWIKTGDVT